MRLLILALLAAALAARCGDRAAPTAPAPSLVERARVSMGSEVRLTARADEQVALPAFDAVFAEFERLDALLSVWRAGSDVVRVNEAAGGAPVAIARETVEVLRTARQAGDWTGGKFDVTFGALSDLWRFDHDQDNRVPARDEVARRLPLVDYRGVDVDERAGTARLARAGMRLHLGGIGKGYAVDRAAAILRARGVYDFMIQSGGDLYVAGTRGRSPAASDEGGGVEGWRVGIQDPRAPAGQLFAALHVTGTAISTSGDYERFFVSGGRRYHHILDPDSGEPAMRSRSVTIVAARSIMADALATGVFILGPDEGMKLVERLQGVEAVIVTATNQVLVSPGLRGSLVVLAPPHDAP